MKCHVELIYFLIQRRKKLLCPFLFHIAMACAASGSAAALCLDVEAPITNDFHDAEAFQSFQSMALALLIGDVDEQRIRHSSRFQFLLEG